jgi:hypothetical protein
MHTDGHQRMAHGVNVHGLIIILYQAPIHLSKHIIYHITFLDQAFHSYEMSLCVGNEPLHELVQAVPLVARTSILKCVSDVFCSAKLHYGM